MSEERRTNARKRTLRGGKIVYGDYRFTLDCVVRDMSDEGARLKCEHLTEAPDSFFLFDPNEGILRRAEVRWRRSKEMGVAFEGAPINIHTSPDPRLARFRYL
ncbi:PilZ domain-containing protein [Chthonobacter rhizosphaerae]|uniref:PilZ domain-containing protein n=1 Tax=Chthonobacter rhizosphaerae TaxID=2735553 RepID=UPI0015EF77DD|nr:PilZ domain-containing protein [Chthonobacter rhizosphaerae]